jgi:hypothetical protein
MRTSLVKNIPRLNDLASSSAHMTTSKQVPFGESDRASSSFVTSSSTYVPVFAGESTIGSENRDTSILGSERNLVCASNEDYGNMENDPQAVPQGPTEGGITTSNALPTNVQADGLSQCRRSESFQGVEFAELMSQALKFRHDCLDASTLEKCTHVKELYSTVFGSNIDDETPDNIARNVCHHAMNEIEKGTKTAVLCNQLRDIKTILDIQGRLHEISDHVKEFDRVEHHGLSMKERQERAQE